MRGSAGPIGRGIGYIPPQFLVDPAFMTLSGSLRISSNLIEVLSLALSNLNTGSPATYVPILNSTLVSGLNITSTSDFIRLLSVTLGSILTIYSNQVAGAILQVNINSPVYIHPFLNGLLLVGPTLDKSANTWVVNIETGASSQYDSYGFNSFAVTSNGKQLACAEDGIYQVNDTISATDTVSTLIQFAKTNFGSGQSKYLHEVWIGGYSADKLIIKTVTEQGTFYYTARSNTTSSNVNRVDLGKGVISNYWDITLTGTTELDLESLEFFPILTSRRI